MKTTSIKTAIIAVMILVAAAAQAQSLEQVTPPVKILPTPNKGIVKVMYAADVEQPIKVTFYTKNGVVGSDKIDEGSFPNGVSKRYDIRSVKLDDVWVEVKSEQMTVTYHLKASKDWETFQPVLEQTTYNHAQVVSRN